MGTTLYYRITVVADGRAPQRLKILPQAGGLVLVHDNRDDERIALSDDEPMIGQGDDLDGPAYRLRCGSLSVRANRAIIDHILCK
ncbi:hypothetical protein [Methylobacterium radiotolerans]|uniref:hypothetical protein n=1 Tax=Methylobacterium radiotolerans TaxID=31998 RepID=UPI001F1B339F|nr:hypothetical protein [Methylobacterium radiotolerans]UIY45816.1 hypothetical protein LZ599_32435 [Methylobacterium radiotolerans]